MMINKSAVTLKNIVILLLSVAAILFIFRKCFLEEDPKIVTDMPTYNEVETLRTLETKNGSGAEKQYRPAPQIIRSGIPPEEYNKILQELNVAKKQVSGLTIIKAQLKDSIRLAKIETDAAKNKVWKWEKTFASGSKETAYMNERDSILHSERDIKVAVLDRVEREKGQIKYYTDFYSPDSIKFNGGYVYRAEAKQYKDLLRGDVVFDFSKGILNQNSDVLTGAFQVSFFPEGSFVFGAGAGALYQFNDGRVFPFYNAFIKKSIFKLRKP